MVSVVVAVPFCGGVTLLGAKAQVVYGSSHDRLTGSSKFRSELTVHSISTLPPGGTDTVDCSQVTSKSCIFIVTW